MGVAAWPAQRSPSEPGGALRDKISTAASASPCGAVYLWLLHRGALDRAVAAKDAAVARKGPKDRVAVAAFVEELAGVNWHLQFGSVAAYRAGEDGTGLHVVAHATPFFSRRAAERVCVRAGPRAEHPGRCPLLSARSRAFRRLRMSWPDPCAAAGTGLPGTNDVAGEGLASIGGTTGGGSNTVNQATLRDPWEIVNRLQEARGRG